MNCTHCGEPITVLPPITDVYSRALPLRDTVYYHASPHLQLARIWCGWEKTTRAEPSWAQAMQVAA